MIKCRFCGEAFSETVIHLHEAWCETVHKVEEQPKTKPKAKSSTTKGVKK